MRDLPQGPELLAAARAALFDELLPLLPADRRIDAFLVANAMAIAEREASAQAALTPVAQELAALYRHDTLPAAADGVRELWRRFAGDLRRGAFATSASRESRARAILWQLTLAKLRLANPRFLHANGIE
jgi:Domain of unknown function (DUF6285)